ncbi:MAG: dihydrofolate reductase [Bernardetiaceae bacterium]|nr:dihydrofolate reductase [Bernardetiaceae bacterium]
MQISMIAARSRNNVIGKDNGMPWHLPADLRYFKNKTSGHYVIVGRKTFESFGKHLKNRSCLVLTQKDFYPLQSEDSQVIDSLDEALDIAAINEETEVFIIGGAQIYEMGLDYADTLYITEIDAEFEGDTFFPDFDRAKWQLVKEEKHKADDKNPFDYSFCVYKLID